MNGYRGRDCGHGHVWPNADGSVAKCMGPQGCIECIQDQAVKDFTEQMATAEARADSLLANQYTHPEALLTKQLEAMKNQLLIVLVNRMGCRSIIPVSEVDATGGWMLEMAVDGTNFIFTTKKKH